MKGVNPQLVFILGCQRSGTTMLLNILDRDYRSCSYPEWSNLCVPGEARRTLRWRELEDVQRLLARRPAELIVTKPIVESQRANELLDFFGNGKAVWMFRGYRDVASSNVVQFNAGLCDLKPIRDRNPSDWRSSRTSDEVVNIVQRFFDQDLTPHEAAAVFWLARNQLYLDERLDEHPRVKLVRYEDFVADPSKALEGLYRYFGVSYPTQHIGQAANRKSVGKGGKVAMRTEIADLCEALQERIERACVNQ